MNSKTIEMVLHRVVQDVQNGCKTENGCVQGHSKVSESDGCPSGYAGRMGETVYAQRHSKVSEWLSKIRRGVSLPAGTEYIGRIGRIGQIGRMEKNKHHAGLVSKMSKTGKKIEN